MDAKKLAQAVSVCQNLSKKFNAFSVVAELLDDFGDLEKQCALRFKQQKELDSDIARLVDAKAAAELDARDAKAVLQAAVANRDSELEAQEAVGEDIRHRANVEAKNLVSDAQAEVYLVLEASGDEKAKADAKLSKVWGEVGDATNKLQDLNEEIAAIKAKF